MATIKRFEDLIVWQKARELCREIHGIIRKGEFASDFKLRDQINSSSGSVMDNIAEGFERSGRKEFIQFLGIAKGSCGEVRSQLHRALDRRYITESEFQRISDNSVEIGKMLNGLISYLNISEVKGMKYKSRVEEPNEDYAVAEQKFNAPE